MGFIGFRWVMNGFCWVLLGRTHLNTAYIANHLILYLIPFDLSTLLDLGVHRRKPPFCKYILYHYPPYIRCSIHLYDNHVPKPAF
jgi:hypothetical protein